MCGKDCQTWQECVAIQRARPPRNPDDYEMIYDTGVQWTPEQVEAYRKRIADLYPFMTRDETVMAAILHGAAQVCARVGGSAGSGSYSKFVNNCRVRARKRGVIFDSHGRVVTEDENETTEGEF